MHGWLYLRWKATLLLLKKGKEIVVDSEVVWVWLPDLTCHGSVCALWEPQQRGWMDVLAVTSSPAPTRLLLSIPSPTQVHLWHRKRNGAGAVPAGVLLRQQLLVRLSIPCAQLHTEGGPAVLQSASYSRPAIRACGVLSLKQK